MREIVKIIGPCSKYIDGKGWTTEVPVDKLKELGFIKHCEDNIVLSISEYKRFALLEEKIKQGLMLELPRKCYLVLYCFGWEIIEYNVLSIKYDYTNKEIVVVTCVDKSKHSYTFFTKEDIGETWFLTKEQAEQKLKELNEEV